MKSTLFCPSHEIFHAVVLRGVRHVSDTLENHPDIFSYKAPFSLFSPAEAQAEIIEPHPRVMMALAFRGGDAEMLPGRHHFEERPPAPFEKDSSHKYGTKWSHFCNAEEHGSPRSFQAGFTHKNLAVVPLHLTKAENKAKSSRGLNYQKIMSRGSFLNRRDRLPLYRCPRPTGIRLEWYIK